MAKHGVLVVGTEEKILALRGYELLVWAERGMQWGTILLYIAAARCHEMHFI